MTKKGKNGDKLQYGETLCVVHLIHYGFLLKLCKNYCILQITWNHYKGCVEIKLNFFNANAKSEESRMSVQCSLRWR